MRSHHFLVRAYDGCLNVGGYSTRPCTRIKIHDGFVSNVATTAFEPLQLVKTHSLSVETVSFQDRESRVLLHIEYPFQPQEQF